MNLPDLIKTTRKNLNLTQKDFGKLIGKSISCVSRYEAGHIIPPGDIVMATFELRKKQKGSVPENRGQLM